MRKQPQMAYTLLACLLIVTVVLGACGSDDDKENDKPQQDITKALEAARSFSGSNAVWTPVTHTFDGTKMVLVPAGCFDMGSEDGGSDESPVNRVCIEEPFWIDRTEVTRGQYDKCVTAGACEQLWVSDVSTRDNQPINEVDWLQARDFCAWREARLPTEAEWEFAARGPDGLVYPWGNEFVADNAVFGGNADQTAAVGSIPGGASWVGALDLSGNVWEWTHTIFQDYPYQADDGRESEGDSERSRILRGGSYDDSEDNLRAAERYHPAGEWLPELYGFRCARSIDSD